MNEMIKARQARVRALDHLASQALIVLAFIASIAAALAIGLAASATFNVGV